MNVMMDVTPGRRRIGLIDRQAIEASLDIAARALLPEEYSQRDVFRVLMPKLFFMRKRGFGFKQITKLLNDAGLKLAIGTVRTYYHEFLMDMLEQCESYYQSAARADKGESAARERPHAARADAREAEVSRAQAQIRSQVEGQAAARTEALLGRLVGGEGAATHRGAAGAWLAPAPATAPSAPSPEGPATRGTTQAPVPGNNPEPKSNPPLRQASPPKTINPRQPLVAADAGPASVTCVTDPEPAKVKEEPNLPTYVYADKELEHPGIPGLMLSKAQRFYTMRLQYRTADGEVRTEKGSEMVARRNWKPMQETRTGRTSGDFVEMQPKILGKPKN